MPHYRKHGKLLTGITDEEFAEHMENGRFLKEAHKPYPVLLYYSAVRKMEALRVLPEQFTDTEVNLWFDVGPRLKKIRRRWGKRQLSEKAFLKRIAKAKDRITTPPIPIPKKAPYVDLLADAVERAEVGGRVFPWSPKTAYNIIDRAFFYPHFFRLSRITWFFLPHPEIGRPNGFSIAEVKNWTGLSLGALEYYIGRANVQDMGRALFNEQLKGALKA